MKKGQGLSLAILLVSILFVMQFENVISQASKLVDENYKLSNQIFFNLNNDFEYRAQIFTIDEAFLIVGRTSVQYISKEGQLVWEKEVSSQNVSVSAGSDYFVLAEKKAGDIFVIDNEGKITAKRFSIGTLESIKCFDEGYLGVVKTGNELLLLDQKLKTVCSTILPKGIVIEYDVDVSKQNIATLVLDLSRKEFNSKLVISSFNGNIISGSNINEAIAYGMRLQKNRISILSDLGIQYYGNDGKLIKSFNAEQVISSFILENQPWLYLTNTLSETAPVDAKKERIIRVDSDGNIMDEFEPPIAPIKGLKPFGDYLMAFNTEVVVLFNLEGKIIETYKGSEEIRDIHMVGNDGFAIEYINHLDIYSSK